MSMYDSGFENFLETLERDIDATTEDLRDKFLPLYKEVETYYARHYDGDDGREAARRLKGFKEKYNRIYDGRENQTPNHQLKYTPRGGHGRGR